MTNLPSKFYRIKRLQRNFFDTTVPLISLDDYLTAANNMALLYFKNNTGTLHRLWEYHGLNPKCTSHSTYTYAAFLTLTQMQNRSDLQKDIRWAGGNYCISDNALGLHAWLEKKEGSKWKAFETIPHMRDYPGQYFSFCTFQLNQDKIQTVPRSFPGLLLHTIYGFTNT